tara:strand:- start:612 stop:2534 length:1923 start_codon:yes stop_codon:yes gene_type:complete
MDLELFKQKVADGSLTVGEAFDYVAARKDTKKPDTIRGLKNNVAVDLDSKFFDTYNTKEFSEALEEPTNRWAAYGAFEEQFKKGLKATKVAGITYEKLAGKGNVAQGFGLKGVQDRPKDPMRGTIYSRDFDRVYNKALSDPLINQEAKDYLIYEKYTGQRVETNIGTEGLKITDLAVSTDPNGNVVVNISEKKSETKTRPAVKYTGAFAQFLAGKKEQALAREAGSNPSTKNLFAISKGVTDKVWNTHVKPALEAEFKDSLPSDGKGGGKATPKVLRKIIARQLVDEFKYPRDLVKGWMGHAGATVTAQGDLLEQSYVGAITDPRVGEISDNLIKTEALNLNKATVNDMFVARSPNTSKGFIEGKAYNAHSSPYTFGNENVKQPITELTDVQKQTLAATQQTQLNQAQIKLYESETARDKARKERIIASQDTMVEDIKKKESEKKIKAELKKESKLLNTPASPDDLSDGLKEKLAKWGITLGGGTNVLATLGIIGMAKEAEADYDKYREQGRSPVVSGLGAAAETVRDIAVEGGSRAVSMLPNMLLSPSPAGEGSDIPPEVNANAPEVENTSDTTDSNTLPPEALKIMQEDADMINTDLDPEAGFISQADVIKNQQMGSPTSQGFMSKYGEKDQDLLQTT